MEAGTRQEARGAVHGEGARRAEAVSEQVQSVLADWERGRHEKMVSHGTDSKPKPFRVFERKGVAGRGQLN